jgi:hypothetical protein
MEGQEEFGETQKVEILLHEYDALRSEIVGRTSDGFTLVSVAGSLFIGALALVYHTAGLLLFILTAIAGTVACFLGARETFYRIGRAAERLREIEADINSRVDETLLVWETQWGAAKKGWFAESLRVQKSKPDAERLPKG